MFVIINKIAIFVYNNKHYGEKESCVNAVFLKNSESSW